MLIRKSEVVTFDQRLYYSEKLGAKQDRCCVSLVSCVVANDAVHERGTDVTRFSSLCSACKAHPEANWSNDTRSPS